MPRNRQFAGAAFAIAASLVALGVQSHRQAVQEEALHNAGRDQRRIASGDEVLIIFIGASFCRAVDVAGFPESLSRLKDEVRRQGDAANMRIGIIGVALDWGVPSGLAWLRRFGEFDEVLVGRNWLNTGAVDYMSITSGTACQGRLRCRR